MKKLVVRGLIALALAVIVQGCGKAPPDRIHLEKKDPCAFAQCKFPTN